MVLIELNAQRVWGFDIDLILCSKHDEAGFMPVVSKELSSEMLKGRKLSLNELAKVEVVLIDEDDGEERCKIKYAMTKDFFSRINFLVICEARIDENERNLDSTCDSMIKSVGICVKCFRGSIIN